MELVKGLKRLDEYCNHYNIYGQDLNFNVNDAIRPDWNEKVNLVTLWFRVLKLKGAITDDEVISRVFVRDGSGLDKAEDVDSAMSSIINIISDCQGVENKKFNFLVVDKFNEDIIEKIMELCKDLEGESFELENSGWKFSISRIVSAFLSIKGYTNNSLFIRATDGTSTFCIFVTPSEFLNLSTYRRQIGFLSKIMGFIVTSTVRWGIPSIPQCATTDDCDQEIFKFCTLLNEETMKGTQADMPMQAECWDYLTDLIVKYTDMTEIENEKLMRLSTLGRDRRIESLKSEIDRIKERISSYENALNDYYIQARDRQFELLAFEQVGIENQNFIDFVQMLNDNCFDIEIDNNCLYFSHGAYMEPSFVSGLPALEEYLESAHANYSNEEKSLIRAFLFDNKVKFKVFSRYRIDFGGTDMLSTILGNEGCRNYRNSITEYFPNPHHRYYNCLGSNGRNINKEFSEGNYVGALCTIFFATQSMNIEDTTVWSYFRNKDIQNLLYGDYKNLSVFEDIETGELLTATQVVQKYPIE